MTKLSSVQSLYDLCKKTFTSSSSGTVVSPQAIRTLCSLLDTIVPADVGLRDQGGSEDERGYGFFGNRQSLRSARWAKPINYLNIFENECFSIAIFCLPTSSVIPLHDHPGMTVFSKMLYGSMHVKGYDWEDPSYSQQSGRPEESSLRLAKLSVDNVLSATCPTSILYPTTGGNLHSFTAITSCAVLDVFSPPYSNAADRVCTYYNDYPYSSFSNTEQHISQNDEEGDYAWLEKIKTPDDLYILQGRYMGPVIQP
ncbi:Cysteamine dioxygenase [Zostera marina]|uniref:cysteine dioxygenase n=1 Tax=Zostera marina TaxID=29655 RepID=A0A0K9NWD2_ZOSMR|nr:Cysteamine dioxygenase [Zostera marina]